MEKLPVPALLSEYIEDTIDVERLVNDGPVRIDYTRMTGAAVPILWMRTTGERIPLGLTVTASAKGLIRFVPRNGQIIPIGEISVAVDVRAGFVTRIVRGNTDSAIGLHRCESVPEKNFRAAGCCLIEMRRVFVIRRQRMTISTGDGRRAVVPAFEMCCV
jgi:hypothetical protein